MQIYLFMMLLLVLWDKKKKAEKQRQHHDLCNAQCCQCCSQGSSVSFTITPQTVNPLMTKLLVHTGTKPSENQTSTEVHHCITAWTWPHTTQRTHTSVFNLIIKYDSKHTNTNFSDLWIFFCHLCFSKKPSILNANPTENTQCAPKKELAILHHILLQFGITDITCYFPTESNFFKMSNRNQKINCTNCYLSMILR